MKRTTLTLVMATLCLIFKAKGQEPTKPPLKSQAIIGKVISGSTGEALPGAVIKIASINQTVLSNDKGEFIINLDNGSYKVTAHYLSYKAKTISILIPLHEKLIIALETHDQNLNEVEINAGYYTVKDRERTGSISRVTAETIGKQPVSNPLLALQGTAPGIFIQQTSGNPGSNVNVQIRGRNSIDAGTNPLYVVDGVPFAAQSLSSTLNSMLVFGADGASPLNSISPDEIESIEILKDADATAIYGSRGANGVVLITTKKGKAGKTSFNIDVNTGGSKVSSTLKMMNTQQYLDMRKEAFANDGLSPKATDYDVNGTWDQNRYTNWQKELIGGTAQFSNAKFSVSGGSEHTQVLLGASYLKQGTVFPGDLKYNRLAVNFNANHKGLNNKFNASLSMVYSAEKNNLFGGDLTRVAIGLAPNAPTLYTPDGQLNWENSTWINPLRELASRFQAKGNTLISNLVLSYQLLKNLKIKTSVGFNDNRLRDYNAMPAGYYDPAQNKTSSSSILDLNNSNMQSIIAEPQIDWNMDTGFGKFTVLAGMSFQQQEREQMIVRAMNFASDALIENPKAAATVNIRGYNYSMYRYQGVYGRLNYNLKGKYIVNLTGRRDGSSRFGPGKQFANFGAVGFAWIFSGENWIQQQFPVVSSGKFRATYGITGNDQIGDYEYFDIYNPTAGYNGIPGLNPSRLFNPDFGWEVNKKAELGLDLGLFDERVRLSMGYYRNRSSSQLINYALAATSGFNGIRSNLSATVQNTGFELDINTLNVKGKALNWSSSFNITIPRNKLVSFPDLESSSYASTYVVGKALSVSKVYHSLGINPQSGIWEVEDMNKDGKIIAAHDRISVVELGQRYYGGIKNTLTYKKLEFGFLLQFVKQNSINFARAYDFHPGLKNQPVVVMNNRWQKPGDIATVQRYTTGGIAAAKTAYTQYATSDETITDGSFIRLKNVDVAYTFSMPKAGTSLRLYLQGQNLLTFTRYFGLDPENSALNLPPLRTLILGLNLNF